MQEVPGTIFAMGRVWVNPDAVIAFMTVPELSVIPMGAGAEGMKVFFDQLETETLKEVTDKIAKDNKL